jgi:hypothetical protein
MCVSKWTCPSGSGGTSLAHLDCGQDIADVNSTVTLTYRCDDPATGSRGTGFNTNNQLSGTATVKVVPPSANSDTVSYSLTCLQGTVPTSDQCSIQIDRPQIAFTSNVKEVTSGQTALLGWVTNGSMSSCTITNPDFPDFNAANANNTSVSGGVQTPPITKTTTFTLDCTTLGGNDDKAVKTFTI